VSERLDFLEMSSLSESQRFIFRNEASAKVRETIKFDVQENELFPSQSGDLKSASTDLRGGETNLGAGDGGFVNNLSSRELR